MPEAGVLPPSTKTSNGVCFLDNPPSGIDVTCEVTSYSTMTAGGGPAPGRCILGWFGAIEVEVEAMLSRSVGASEDDAGDKGFIGWLTDRFVCSSILLLRGVLCFERRGALVGDADSDVPRRCPFDFDDFARNLIFNDLSAWLFFFSSSMVSIPTRLTLPFLLLTPCCSTDVNGGLGGALPAAAFRHGRLTFDAFRSVGSGVNTVRVGLCASREPTASLLWAFENVG